MKSMYKLVLPLLMLATLTSGCVLTPAAIDAVLEMVPTPRVQEAVPVVTREPTPLEETTWVLQSLNEVPPFPDVEITMEFYLNVEFPKAGNFNDIIRGHAVCNGYSVAYALSGNRLTVNDALVQSAQECLPESHNDLEQQYFEILTSVEFYKLEGDTLTLSTEQGDTLVFTVQVQ